MEQITAEIVGDPIRHELDGSSDDLLTAGLGVDGLRGAPPEFADPERPTPRELRRRAIHAAYRGLVDTSEAGGFGRLYGPRDERRIAGVEYLVAVRTPDGLGTTSVLLQLPRDFDRANPCLVAVAAAGSRGVYGALPNAGEWGLRRGAAVVHTDKGAGIGVWDIDRARGYRIDGALTTDLSDPLLGFVPALTPELAEFARRAPHSLLFKHAHSRQNPEADWGAYLLQAIKAAFLLLNLELGRRLEVPLTPDNTLVLAAGLSNGGAAVLRALERDRAGWISGAIAVEPNAVVAGRTAGVTIDYGGRRLADGQIALLDYPSLHDLYQPCAVLAETDPEAPYFAATQANRPRLARWCAELQAAGVLPAGPVGLAASAARNELLAAGLLPEGLRLGHFNLVASLWPGIAATYAWAYTRRAPWDPPVGVTFAATDADGSVRSLTAAEAAALWADGNGIPPTGHIALVMRGADGERCAANDGSAQLALAYAPERVLRRARQPLEDLRPGRNALLAAVHAGQQEVVMTARLGNRPVIIIHGRADSLMPVNHTSRAYYAVNQRDRGGRDELRYYELEHGHHFDAYLALPGFADGYVPTQPWMLRGLDALYARLTAGTVLPPSQVIRSRPRGRADGGVPPLGEAHLGALRMHPGADAIGFSGGVLTVPD
ncbi:MAG TPA: 3-hydroxybutyrate oligomer hydrolase family protein [Steroidobacteraceae bacterium]|nr:3-hydroxybutyrate oligomer hydrolase family protein [Steroidobacteraceae bacterium]